MTIGCGDNMIRISIDEENASSLQALTGKTLTKNGNEIIAEVIEMAEANRNPDTPCFMESNCSEQEEVKEKKLQ